MYTPMTSGFSPSLLGFRCESCLGPICLSRVNLLRSEADTRVDPDSYVEWGVEGGVETWREGGLDLER